MMPHESFATFKKACDSPIERRRILSRMKRNRLRQGLKIVVRNSFLLDRVLRNYLMSLCGKFPLRSLEIAVGYECNFSCEQCSCALNRDRGRKRLSLEQFKVSIEQAVEMGAFQFNLNGGEPMLYFEEVRELCQYIRDRRCYVHMATNGFYFTPERMKLMKNAGLSSFEMGLDSSVESVHDANRGVGSFKKIMENTNAAKKLGLVVAYNTVGSRDKILSGDLLRLVRLSEEKDVLLMITPPCVTGHWAGKMEVLLNKDEQWYIRWVLSTHAMTRIDNYNGLRRISCPAAREKMAVNPYGDVTSCPLIQIIYGNVLSDRLVDIQKNMLKDQYYLKGFKDGCLPSHNLEFIRDRLINFRDLKMNKKLTES
ncbi:MAG: radical SAM protein [Candidatus Omnitrophota bacterium]|nr:radical SAM protein [Candidatus Omnitrophota bacterium]